MPLAYQIMYWHQKTRYRKPVGDPIPGEIGGLMLDKERCGRFAGDHAEIKKGIWIEIVNLTQEQYDYLKRGRYNRKESKRLFPKGE